MQRCEEERKEKEKVFPSFSFLLVSLVGAVFDDGKEKKSVNLINKQMVLFGLISAV